MNVDKALSLLELEIKNKNHLEKSEQLVAERTGEPEKAYQELQSSHGQIAAGKDGLPGPVGGRGGLVRTRTGAPLSPFLCKTPSVNNKYSQGGEEERINAVSTANG